MSITQTIQDSPVRRGIKTVAVGKKGSKPLDPQLVDEIIAELKSLTKPSAALGALMGGLMMKGLEPQEQKLDQIFSRPTYFEPHRLVEELCSETPKEIQQFCERLLRKEELNKDEAYHLGQFLFSNRPGDAARGLVSSILRVRYETADEYEGLWLSMQETISVGNDFKPFLTNQSIIQIAEPFDGVDHSYMITPLIADSLNESGYKTILLVGRNSGPKLVYNLQDVLSGDRLVTGTYLSLEEISPAINRWVEIRREIIKRPFLATLERFLNPVNANICIASAFHPPYGEKMLTIAERAGFPATIIVRNGIEGTIAFPLKRPVKMLCSVRQKNGTFLRHEIEFNAEEFLGISFDVEEKLDLPSLENNVKLINKFRIDGATENKLFDARVKATTYGIKSALNWIETHKNGE